ncbi:MAG: hypothetical protein ABH837_02610 [bacterium]
MTTEKFVKIQKKLAQLSRIPLSEIKRKFPDFRSSKEKIKKFIKEHREAIRNLNQKEIIEEISQADPENIKNVLDAASKKYFAKKFRTTMERPEFERQINILNSENPDLIQGFIKTGAESEVIINTNTSWLRKIFHHITRNYEITGESQAEDMFKKFLIEKKDEIATVLRVHLKLYNKKGSPFRGKLYEIFEPQAFDRQMTNLIIEAVKSYKKTSEALPQTSNQGQTPSG